jgi:hypothetical protein
MLSDEVITQRLNEMATKADPSSSKWPENCAGSRRALVIFLGPSPGGKKNDNREDIELDYYLPLWDKAYLGDINKSRGFEVRLKEIAGKVFNKPDFVTLKLIARFNLDWMQNPKSEDVPFQYMWDGINYVLPIIIECRPELIIPMDAKTFNMLQAGLCKFGFDISFPEIREVKIPIYKKKGKMQYHDEIMALKAKNSDQTIIVIKSFQHPSKIFESSYAQRIGEAIRLAGEQMEMDSVVNISLPG